MRRSVVEEGYVSENRTSRNTWMALAETDVIEGVSRRAFGLLNIPYERATAPGISESYQVVHYALGQQYT